MKKLVSIGCLFFLCISSSLYAQKYSEYTLRAKLDSLAIKQTGLNNKLQLNVSSLPLSELVNSAALENNLNVVVDPSINQLITYNFFDAQIKDIFIYMYLNFDLEYEFVGSIISIKKRTQIKEKPVQAPRKIEVTYNPGNHFLSLNLKGDTLHKVLETITRLNGTNFVISPEVKDKIVNAYFENRPDEQVYGMLAKANNLDFVKENDYFLVKPQNTNTNAIDSKLNGGNKKEAELGKDFVFKKLDDQYFDIYTNNVDLNTLIKTVTDEMNIPYILFTTLEGKTNLDLKHLDFDQLTSYLFNGTKYSCKKNENLYTIGENKMEGIRTTEMVRLENRTIEVVKSIIPKDMLMDLEVTEFVELNALIVTGNSRKIEDLKAFVRSIDVIVPMVQIDVMLVYSKRSSEVNTGISAGLGTQPTTTSGTILPGIKMDIGATEINNILQAINGFGIVNLGQVTENFYVSLSALESNNIIDIESTPKISTLNGHEAKLSIGETTYYQETQVNVSTSVTQQGVLQSKQWKSIDANLAVTLKPFVSADEHVTMTISVEQNDFAGKVDPASPPNMSTQNFSSMIRVKNGDVFLLGGLEKKKKNDSGSGTPWLARVPVLKWFFGNRSKAKEKSKLHILIRPTVTY